MTVKRNDQAYEHAEGLIDSGKVVRDDRDAWSEHQPSTDEENAYIEEHGWPAYALWHLGLDDQHAEGTKARYKFPYGDFEKAHRCGLLAAESRAAQNDYADIEKAAHRLHELIDEGSD
jgi:hypothetical protein